MTEILQEWRESAPYWDHHAETIRTMFAPMTTALIEDAGIAVGDSVLDIAGGTGEPSVTIAEYVGPNGLVTCTDAVQEMVFAAEKHATRHGQTNIRFQQCPADSLPFETNSFDAVVCRLGAMFFPDPPTAARETVRVLKPGGKFAFIVWSEGSVNPFLQVVTDVISRYFESTPPDPDAPDTFRFAQIGKLASLFTDAGAIELIERILKFQIAAPVSRSEFWKMRSGTSRRLRAKLETVTTQNKAQIESDVIDALVQFFPNEQMNFPAEVLVVSGRKSR